MGFLGHHFTTFLFAPPSILLQRSVGMLAWRPGLAKPDFWKNFLKMGRA
jgi:hypothetical protein